MTNIYSSDDTYGNSFSNSEDIQTEGVMDALHELQDKIRRLDLERNDATNRLGFIASDTAHYRDVLKHEHDVHEKAHNKVDKKNSELQSQLNIAQLRCQQLEQELNTLRQSVENVEQRTRHASPDSRLSPVPPKRTSPAGVSWPDHSQDVQSWKFDEFNKNLRDLGAAQQDTERRMAELHRLFEEERRHSHRVPSAQQLVDFDLGRSDTEFDAAGDFTRPPTFSSTHSQLPVAPPALKQQTQHRRSMTQPTATSSRKSSRNGVSRSPPSHTSRSKSYRGQFSDIPFIGASSSSQSHNLNANLQQFLHLLKHHTPRLCTGISHSASETALRGDLHREKRTKTHSSTSASTSTTSVTDLEYLLQAMKEEYDSLSGEYHELEKDMEEAQDEGVKAAVREELLHLDTKIDIKADQIRKVKDMLRRAHRKQSGLNGTSGAPSHHGVGTSSRQLNGGDPSTMKSHLHDDGDEMHVVTTVKARSGKASVTTTHQMPARHAAQGRRVMRQIDSLKRSISSPHVTSRSS